MHRSAILGCGPRSFHHAAAYSGLDEMQLVAACDMNLERLDEYGDTFGIEKRYEDLELMLQIEKPDLNHIVTQPMIREQSRTETDTR